MTRPPANLDFYSWDDINLLMYHEPAFAHLTEMSIFCHLDWLGEDVECICDECECGNEDRSHQADCDTFECYCGADQDDIIGSSVVRYTTHRELYSRETLQFLADAGVEIVCCLCGEIEEQSEAARNDVPAEFANWLTSREVMVKPLCRFCSEKAIAFSTNLHGHVRLQDEAECVAALHFITKSNWFKKRVRDNAQSFSKLRFDPRLPNSIPPPRYFDGEADLHARQVCDELAHSVLVPAP